MHLVGSLPHVSIIMLVHKHKRHREYKWQLPWWSIRRPIWGKSQSYTHDSRSVPWTSIDLKFQQSKSSNDLNCLDVIEECLYFNHRWTDPFTKSSGKSHAPLFLTPVNSADSFPWPYTGIAFTHVIHKLLHIMWGVQVVALLKPSRDSGMQVGSPLILMPKEPTRSNMAPRSLFGIRVFVQRS